MSERKQFHSRSEMRRVKSFMEGKPCAAPGCSNPPQLIGGLRRPDHGLPDADQPLFKVVFVCPEHRDLPTYLLEEPS